MTDRWSARLDRIDRAVDLVMAETVRIVPVLEGDFTRGAPDPARPAYEVEGVLTIARGETDLGGNAQHLRNARVTTARAELQVMRQWLAVEPRRNDRVVALGKGLTFRIERIDRQHPGRLVLVLSIAAEGVQ